MTRRRQKRNQENYWNNQPGLFDIAVAVDSDEDILRPMEDSALKEEERLRFISFGSGSSGNCAYIGTPSCGLIIDAGVDNHYVLEQLAANSIEMETIRGIILTHDHGDHVRYAYSILRRYQHMRLYATPKALNGLLRRHSTSRRIRDYHTPIFKEFPLDLGSMTVTPFETSHDGTDNAGFFIQGGGTTFVITTDTGTITTRSDYYMRQAEYLMIESNYDATMLRNGPYPQHLQARIASTSGHLDNADTARYLAAIAPGSQLRRVFLCHLSQDNNTPQIALKTITEALEAANVAVSSGPESLSDTRLRLHVLPRSEASYLFVLNPVNNDRPDQPLVL